MALRGASSKSFLRSKELIAFAEISYDSEGNNILKHGILKEALARDNNGKLIRNKRNIAQILDKYGIKYRMIFNTMNMSEYTYHEIQDALNHLSEYLYDLGVSGIVEFHASDKTQNSDHIHFWINSEDRVIYNKIAQEMIAMGYSNKEDIRIQQFNDNQKREEIEYIDKKKEVKDIVKIQKEKYHCLVTNINNLLSTKVRVEKNFSQNINLLEHNSIIKNCSLPKTREVNDILLKLEELTKDI